MNTNIPIVLDFEHDFAEVLSAQTFSDIAATVGHNEACVGVMTDYERALYTLAERYAQLHRHITEYVESGRIPPESAKVLPRLTRYRELAIERMLQSIRDRYGILIAGGGYGIRHGFLIIVRHECADALSSASDM